MFSQSFRRTVFAKRKLFLKSFVRIRNQNVQKWAKICELLKKSNARNIAPISAIQDTLHIFHTKTDGSIAVCVEELKCGAVERVGHAQPPLEREELVIRDEPILAAV